MIYFVPMDLTMHIFLCLFSLIITGDTTTQIMKLILGEDSLPGLRQLCIIVVAFSVMLPLCLLRDIGMLEKFSTISVSTVFIVAILVFVKLVGKGVAGDVDGVSAHNLSVRGIVTSVGIFSFSFVCNDVVFLYYNTLFRGTEQRFQRVTKIALAGSALMTCAFGSLGYLSFGEDTKPNILNNYHDDDVIATVMRALYVVTMALTYPIGVFVCRQVLHCLIRDMEGKPRTDVQEVSLIRHLCYTLAIFLASVGIVMKVTDLGVVMSMTGNVAGSVLGYVLPGLIGLSERAGRTDQCGPRALLAFGCVTAILGVVLPFL